MATLDLTITNSSGYTGTIYMGFYCSSTNFNVTYGSQPVTPLANGSVTTGWMECSQYSQSPFVITNFSGRIYFCYGGTFDPNLTGQNSSLESFYLRFDKMEMTFNGDQSDCADLTAIDFWAIPITLNGLLNGKIVTNPNTGLPNTAQAFLNDSITAQMIFDNLNKLTYPTPQSAVQGAIPAVVPGPYQTVAPAGTGFCRVIGPSSYATLYPLGMPSQPYDTMLDYLQSLFNTYGGASFATINGTFAGVSPAPGTLPPAYGVTANQKYNAEVSFNINPAKCSPSDSTPLFSISGTADNLNSISSNYCGFNIDFYLADLLNPNGLYGANPNNLVITYTPDGTTTPTVITESPQNDVFGWIVADLLAGFNIGAVGSTVILSGGTTPVGQMPSSDWFQIPQEQMYGTLQPDNPFYNQFAAALSTLTQAYNFPYTDRINNAGVQVLLSPGVVDTLEIVLEDATVTLPAS